jgi:peptidoglycan/xylan/chitin deacetylase (PgdA/CDA1 family)
MGWRSAAMRAGYDVLGRSGVARLLQKRRGEPVGAIFRIERVRPPSYRVFQPFAVREITPRFLDRMLAALRRWGYDLISIEQCRERLIAADFDRRFACITFDDAHRDILDHAYPVLKRHEVPFAVYVPTGFPDRLVEPWWLGIEQVIAREQRVGVVMQGREVRLDCGTPHAKQLAFEHIWSWLEAFPAYAQQEKEARDFCARYRVGLAPLADASYLDWYGLSKLAADSLVTLASATVSFAPLVKLDAASAEREMRMGQSVIEAATGRRPQHFAYPHGSAGTFGQRETTLAAHIGFRTAVTGEARALEADDRYRLLRLPRVSVDGMRQSLGWLRLALVRPDLPPPLERWDGGDA